MRIELLAEGGVLDAGGGEGFGDFARGGEFGDVRGAEESGPVVGGKGISGCRERKVGGRASPVLLLASEGIELDLLRRHLTAKLVHGANLLLERLVGLFKNLDVGVLAFVGVELADELAVLLLEGTKMADLACEIIRRSATD